MLYVYFGEDTDTARKKVQATVGRMLAKSPEALYFRITGDVLGEYDFDELTQAQALFKNEYIVVLDMLLQEAGGEEVVLNNLEKIVAAPHPFFILEGKLTAPLKRKFEKHAEQTHEFTAAKKAEKDTFNTFTLTDALGERDVKKLWTLFREAKQHSVSDEEIHGILFWMLKSLVLVMSAQTAADAGMKPYPFNKAKGFAKNFGNTDELKALLMQFALMPQHARRRGTLLEIELERFILSLRS